MSSVSSDVDTPCAACRISASKVRLDASIRDGDTASTCHVLLIGAPTMSAKNMPRLMAAGAIGNMLEWYDFAVSGYFATAIGRAFFPEQDKVAQVLAAFGVFAVGFMMRPVGGALFGHIGDRLGRRTALTPSTEGPLDFARGKLHPEWRDLTLGNKLPIVERRSLRYASPTLGSGRDDE